MPTPFALEVLEATAACDDVMAERFLLSPRKASRNTNAPPDYDPHRPPMFFMATFRDPEAKPLIPRGYDSRTDDRPGTQSGHPRIQVTPSEVLRTGLVLNAGDLITREGDQIVWRVSTTHTSTSGILRAEVNLVGPSPLYRCP